MGARGKIMVTAVHPLALDSMREKKLKYNLILILNIVAYLFFNTT